MIRKVAKENCTGANDKGLAQKLADQLSPAAAHYFSQPDLFASLQGLGDSEIDKIDTGDGQDKSGNAHEDIGVNRITHITDPRSQECRVEVHFCEGLQSPDRRRGKATFGGLSHLVRGGFQKYFLHFGSNV